MFPLKQSGQAKTPVNVNAASIIDLKAELLRKKDELRSKQSKDTTSQASTSLADNDTQLYDASKYKAFRLPKKIQNVLVNKKGEDKSTRKEDKHSKTQTRLEDEKSLAKSREMLIKKSQLYEEIKRGRVVVDHQDSDDLLVNFDEKARIYRDEDSDEDDADMIEIVDSFGRSRKVSRRDAHLYEAQADDDHEHEDEHSDEDGEEDCPREEMPVNVKPNIFYADVDDGEVRDHGAAHYALSADEDTRAKQLAMLNSLRKDTENKRAEKIRIKERRAHMVRDRLAKIAARKGIELKPEGEHKQNKTTPSRDEENDVGDTTITIQKANETMKAERDRQTIKIRDWDVGKDGLYTAAYSLRPAARSKHTDYYDRLRDERNRMFAPPQTYEPGKKRPRTASPTTKHSDEDDEDEADSIYDVGAIVDDKLSQIRRHLQ